MQIFTYLITSLSYSITLNELQEIIELLHSTPNYYKKTLTFFLPSIRRSGKNINFEDKKINKSNFYKNKKLFKIEGIDINNIIVYRKGSYSTENSLKYLIGYNDDDVIRPL